MLKSRVPTAGQIAYRSFLKSDFWTDLSAEKKRQVGCCEECGSTSSLQAHHLTYPEDWYETTLEHLQVLCRKCHKKAHGLAQAPVIDIYAYRDDDQFNRFVHWCHYLHRRIVGRMTRLKVSERRYLSAAMRAYPDVPGDKAMSYSVSMVLGSDEWCKAQTA